jgi:DNA-directed RNA polymerase subunit RPC12/RpoP
MNILTKYNRCIYCNSKKLIKNKKQDHFKNFYVKAIMSDLKISNQTLKKIKVFKCNNCKLLQNNPWFSEEVSQKIYSNIYGQHNRGWANLLNFLKKGSLPNHGNLFKILNGIIKIRKYAEFNSPFMGILINFFSQEYKKDLFFYKNLLKNIINYLTLRQVAGKSKIYQKLSFERSKKIFNQLNTIKI